MDFSPIKLPANYSASAAFPYVSAAATERTESTEELRTAAVESSEQPEDVTSSPPVRSDWRLRDAAHELLEARSAGSTVNHSMPLLNSTQLDTEAALLRLRRDKLYVIQQSLDVAATSVLEALFRPNRHGQQQDAPMVPVNPHDLPAALVRRDKSREWRVEALFRSRDNKEHVKLSKLQGAKVEAAPVVPKPPAVPPKKRASATKRPSGSAKNASGPKFTRNTPASSAAALDFRFNSSRAILCAAGNLAFDALTPCPPGHEDDLDAVKVPQNKSKASDTGAASTAGAAASTATTASTTSATDTLNMGAVVVEAQKLAQRTISVTSNAVRRSKMRYRYRKDNARYDNKDRDFWQVQNPFAYKDDDKEDPDSVLDTVIGEGTGVPHAPNQESLTTAWTSNCLPRLLSVLETGAGHAVYHDVQWASRHGRIANLLQTLAQSNEDNMGPHLIVCTEPEVDRFAQEFYDMSTNLRLVIRNESKSLHSLGYRGTKQHRRGLRRFFPQGTGLPEAPFHVIVTSYALFLEDYFHFCQLPFETVILDDGAAWMACAQGDPNSAVGSIWDGAIWSKNDHHVGLAGPSAATQYKEWDFTADRLPDVATKEALIGLTTRHRIMTSSTLRMPNRLSVDLVPVSGLVSFLAPQFADVVREEWDRSKITSDASSMEHYRKLVARSTIVHHSESVVVTDMQSLAMSALDGQLSSPDRENDPAVPQIITDDAFVSKGMVAFSRRTCLAWLGAPEKSWLRYELGVANLKHILDAMKVSSSHGPFCEEITTASSTTTSGATGQVAGSMAYRLAVRCNRHFGSEQGLRQHVSALHAPSGTWLCRTCGTDCITSQSRTHHERSCGQPASGTSNEPSVGATPTVGQGAPAKSGVGKKKAKANQQAAAAVEEKDPDGSFRVPGYRGVWVNTAGKHFVKIAGERLKEGDSVVVFDSVDDAARKHDEVAKARKEKGKKVELNFKADGSRVVYEDITPASTSGLGSNVVPQLSRINIKDLPPDVKPLLRDPRQTSRTGGNSKRHVYAYRGVCRQARKGHDRWQSQISFMGVNHYLGTFDSEWDAAAIYAWAHLILYGEEATRQAQKEGEEAAAAFEQEKKDIAAGKIPEPPPKPEKKKKPKKDKKQNDAKSADGDAAKNPETKKRKAPARQTSAGEKKLKPGAKTARGETIAPVLAKGVAKAPILTPRDMDDGDAGFAEYTRMVGARIVAARTLGYYVSSFLPSAADPVLRPCVPVNSVSQVVTGGAMLLGLSPSLFGWDLEQFVAKSEIDLASSDLNPEQAVMTAMQMLAVEYDDGGVNQRFRTMVQGITCVIGNASTRTQRLYKELGLGAIPVGGSVADLDCHIGGVPGSCSEKAALIQYAPKSTGPFQLSCLCDDDMVTLNGQRITSDMGSFPLLNEDVVSVGARVFVFLVPPDGGEYN